MKKKWLVSLLAASICTLALTGCGGNGDSDKSAGGKTTIRFATWDNAEELDRQQAMVDKFNEEHDDIEVKIEAYGKEFDTKISAGMGSGDTPDVMYMWNYPKYYGGLEPLDPFIEKEGKEYKDNFYNALWAYNSIDGNTYGVPVGFTTHALYYNKDIFAQAGVAEPTDDWTWDDLKAASATITEKTGVKGFAFPMKADPYDFEMYLWSNDTSYCDKEGNLEGYINSDKSKEVFTMFQDMEKEGYGVATEKYGTEEFRAQTAAMYINGAWPIKDFDEDGLNYGIVEIPAFKNAGKDSVSILSTSGLTMAKDSKNKDAAWEFIKFWTGEYASKERIGTEMPALYSVVESEGIMEKPEFAPFYKMLEHSDGYTPSSFIVKEWSKLGETLELSFERIFNPTTLEEVGPILDEDAKMQ